MAKTIRKLSAGIYASKYSIRAIVHTAAGRKEKRFEFDTPLADIKRWRNEVKVKLARRFPQTRATVPRHSFTADIRRHLKNITISSWKSRRSELRAWAKALPAGFKRARVTSDHVKKIVKQWHDDAVPPKTILNRIRALTAMYHDLDGDRDAWTPADGVPLPKVVSKLPQYVPPAVIVAVERKLYELEQHGDIEPEWRARYMVLTACGARPVHVGRTKPTDVDLEARLWRVESAKGGEPILYVLNGDQLAAWRRFVEVGVWGTWDTTKYAKIVRAAGWPLHVKPYAAKHALSQDLADAGVSRETIADLHGHTDAKTTRFYSPRSNLRKATASIEGRLGWGETKKEEPPRVDPSDLEGLSDADLLSLVDQIRGVVAKRGHAR